MNHSEQHATITRASLSSQLSARFGFDLSGIWQWMQHEGHLSSEVGDNWDPVWGAQGAMRHIAGRTKKHPGERLLHSWVMKSSRGKRLRGPCKLCGISRVVVGCYFEVVGPLKELEFARAFVGQIERERAQLAKLGESVLKNYGIYRRTMVERARGRAMRELEKVESLSMTRQERSKKTTALKRLLEHPESLIGPDVVAECQVETRFSELVTVLESIEDYVLVDLRYPLEQSVWPRRVGRNKELIAKAQAALFQEKFSYKEVATLAREPGPIDDRTIARVRERVRGLDLR
jgi:hypothetical protein